MVEWKNWMENADHIQSPQPIYARPDGLASLGPESYFTEPYRICSPHRIHIGSGVGFGENAFLSVVDALNGVEHDSELRIGDDCQIGSDLCVHCTHDVEIGSRVGISARVAIGDSVNDVNPWLAAETDVGGGASIRIRDGAVLGIGSIVLPGVTIGERAAVGAGAVVARDVPPRTVVFGNPARIVGSWNDATGEWLSGLVAPR